ncbi:hypothetical protein Zmor_000195 [Zophobas morio]|uniref:Uncharacterized protein n=1 Tax=Zophobas morio TaxID=2755281 RepID=A0AA38MR06_9CUCU|nr:hypothetical protein Zmor_000195 [Zophobas morio]
MYDTNGRFIFPLFNELWKKPSKPRTYDKFGRRSRSAGGLGSAKELTFQPPSIVLKIGVIRDRRILTISPQTLKVARARLATKPKLLIWTMIHV